MPITVNKMHVTTTAKETLQPGEPGFLREQTITRAERSLLTDWKNPEAVCLLIGTVRDWSEVQDADPRKILAQLDADNGRLRRQLAAVLMARTGQECPAESVGVLARAVNTFVGKLNRCEAKLCLSL
ncbi:MAG TPA: hypothetical protein VHZ52_07405 [Acidobacteriaceae bacterium]|jgi:hypothetical protein|nr:hypothetical protein [Acidobacteriaceae bacterium]